MRDSQKSKVYKSDSAVTDTAANERLESVEEIQAWVDKIARSRWWRTYDLPSATKARHKKGRKIGYSRIRVKDGRARRSACGGAGEIKMPKFARTRLITLHEVAHAIQTENPAHGRQFARIYLDLVTRFIGKEAGRQLKAAFIKHGVRSGPKRPTTAPGNPHLLKKSGAESGNSA